MHQLFVILLLAVTILSCYEGTDPLTEFRKGNYERSYELWFPLANSGNSEAQNYIGIHYYLGLGVKRNFRKAMHWFELAAKSGHADAQYNLGKMYENGENTERDFTTAYMWFFAAHKQGNKNARKHMKALSEEHKLFPNQMHHAEKSAKEFITP